MMKADKKGQSIVNLAFGSDELVLSSNDKKTVELSSIAETSIFMFLEAMKKNYEFKKHKITKAYFKIVIWQLKMILAQIEKINEKILKSMTRKEATVAIDKSYKLLKLMEKKL